MSSASNRVSRLANWIRSLDFIATIGEKSGKSILMAGDSQSLEKHLSTAKGALRPYQDAEHYARDAHETIISRRGDMAFAASVTDYDTVRTFITELETRLSQS